MKRTPGYLFGMGVGITGLSTIALSPLIGWYFGLGGWFWALANAGFLMLVAVAASSSATDDLKDWLKKNMPVTQEDVYLAGFAKGQYMQVERFVSFLRVSGYDDLAQKVETAYITGNNNNKKGMEPS